MKINIKWNLELKLRLFELKLRLKWTNSQEATLFRKRLKQILTNIKNIILYTKTKSHNWKYILKNLQNSKHYKFFQFWCGNQASEYKIKFYLKLGKVWRKSFNQVYKKKLRFSKLFSRV